jgi:hypothetical protein
MIGFSIGILYSTLTILNEKTMKNLYERIDWCLIQAINCVVCIARMHSPNASASARAVIHRQAKPHTTKPHHQVWSSPHITTPHIRTTLSPRTLPQNELQFASQNLNHHLNAEQDPNPTETNQRETELKRESCQNALRPIPPNFSLLPKGIFSPATSISRIRTSFPSFPYLIHPVPSHSFQIIHKLTRNVYIRLE